MLFCKNIFPRLNLLLVLLVGLIGCSNSSDSENEAEFSNDKEVVDTTPNVFSFIPQTNVAKGVLVTSNVVTITGLSSPTDVSIEGGTYSINGGTFLTEVSEINNHDQIEIQLTSSEQAGGLTQAVLTIGGLTGTFEVSTLLDLDPDAFSFTAMTNIEVSTLVASETILITGINTEVSVNVTGGEYSINGDPFSNSPGLIENGSTLQVRGRASDMPGTITLVGIEIGSAKEYFSITTTEPIQKEELTLNITVQPVRENFNNGNDEPSEFNWVFRGISLTSGQFANGDYWVASETGNEIELVSLTSNQVVGLDDARTLDSQGFFAADYGNYDASKNLALVLSSEEKVYSQNTVLVAATQRNQEASSKCGTKGLEARGCIDAYNFVTVLNAPPPGNGADFLRPPLTGWDKSIQPLSDFDFTRLPNLSYIEATEAQDLEEAERMFRHGTNVFSYAMGSNVSTFSEGGRAFRCGHILCDDYSAGFSQAYYNALSYIFSANNTFSDKRKLIATLLTLGRDGFAMVHQGGCNAEGATHANGCRYSSGAGQHLGNFIPNAFYVSLEKNNEKASLLRNISTLLDGTQCNLGPQELDQINGHLETPLWGDCGRFGSEQLNVIAYWTDMVEASCYDDAPDNCNLIVGQRASRDPYQFVDGSEPRPGGSYMNIVLGQQRSMVAAACVMPTLANVINYPELYIYVDRLNVEGIRIDQDNCAVPKGISSSSSCADEIWSKRNTSPENWTDNSNACPGFGVLWGPDPSDISQCIVGTGRFNQTSPSISPSYLSKLDQHFDLMRGLAGSDCSG